MLPPLVRDVLGMGPIGPVLLGLPVVAVIASLVALASRSAVGRVACVSAVSAFGVWIAAAWAAVHGSRTRFVESVLYPDSATWPSLVLARAIVAEHYGAGMSLVLVPLVAVAIAVTCARGRSPTFSCGLVATVAVPAWIAAGACFVASGAVLDTSWSDCNAQCRYDAVMASTASLDAARAWLLVCGALTAAAAIVAIAVRGAYGSGGIPRRARVGCVALGAAGFVAYGSTRALAEDARQPLTFEEDASWLGGEVGALPVGSDGCGTAYGPVLSMRASGTASLDGVPASDLLLQLDAKRELWLQLHPGAAFDGTVLVAAPADMPASEPMVAVAVARATGYRVLAARARPVASAPSRTLGAVARSARLCAGTIAEGAPRIGERWGERVERCRLSP